MVVAVADEPGQQSSGQSAQDDRVFFKHARYPFFEPADSQEALDMVKEAYRISEMADTLVALHMTTRICHSKCVVETGERMEVPVRPYEKNAAKYIPLPAHSPAMVRHSYTKLEDLKDYSEHTPFNREEMHDTSIGIVCSGCSYYFAKEVFGDKASYYKIGFVNPLPMESIRAFAKKVDKLYVIEETDPLIENEMRLAGIECTGKDVLPVTGELLPDVLREKLLNITSPKPEVDRDKILPRPPAFCAGCPHRGVFYTLSKMKDIMVASDIGCYSLSPVEPYYVGDTGICMGSSISIGHGFQQVMNKVGGSRRAVAVLGDSTFLHTGFNSLLDVAYNQSNTVTIILDNRITGMTGHQENPGSGFTAQGEAAPEADIPAICRAINIKHVVTVDPNHLDEFKNALDEALALDEPSVIITRWPCALKKMSQENKEEFPDAFSQRYQVDDSACVGCKACLKAGCPAIHFEREKKKAFIGSDCLGCSVCSQICPVHAIIKK